MKKIFALVLCLYFACFCTATDASVINNVNVPGLTITTQIQPDGKLTIGYQAQGREVPQGVAIKVTLTDGLTSNTYNSSVNSLYNAYPDYTYDYIAYTNGFGSGHPFARLDMPGSLNSSTANQLVVSMAAFTPRITGEPPYDLDNMEFSPYDLNEDLVVGYEDFVIFSAYWLCDSTYIPGNPDFLGFNADGRVDMVDLALMGNTELPSQMDDMITLYLNNYSGQQIIIEEDPLRGGIAMGIPEPTTLLLLGLGGLALRLKK